MRESVCHVCGGATLLVEGLSKLSLVSSDSRPVSVVAELGVCRSCGVTQKEMTEEWKSETARIYRDYDMTHVYPTPIRLSDRDGIGKKFRVGELAERVLELVGDGGELLDVGSGNGDLLGAVAATKSQITMDVLETSENHRSRVTAIPGVRSFYTDLSKVPSGYHVITMLHVLEHIPDPISFLVDLKSRLRPGGSMIIQVPNSAVNSPDLLVFDHCSHFIVESLAWVLQKAGLRGLVGTTNSGRELSAVVRLSDPLEMESPVLDQAIEVAVRGVESLSRFRDELSTALRTDCWVLGIGNAGAWLVGEFGDRVVGFLEDDLARTSQLFMGRTVATCAAFPGSDVLALPLWGGRAEHARSRMKDKFRVIVTPSW
jgi:2-polyprenyl-3-methyl-5-hydroxy-6-metoxy-1,4-benzoquinol methylase